MTNKFKKNYEQFYKDHRKHRKYELATDWKCHWFSGFFYYSFLLFGPIFVMWGLIDLVEFIALVKLYSSVYKYVDKVMNALQAIQRSTIALEQIRSLLNMPTDAHEAGAPLVVPEPGVLISFSIGDILSLVISVFTFATLKDLEAQRAAAAQVRTCLIHSTHVRPSTHHSPASITRLPAHPSVCTAFHSITV